jgi:hypothetical protein
MLVAPSQIIGDAPIEGNEVRLSWYCEGCGGEKSFLAYARRRLSGV